jgi:hypothetical protein
LPLLLFGAREEMFCRALGKKVCAANGAFFVRQSAKSFISASPVKSFAFGRSYFRVQIF